MTQFNDYDNVPKERRQKVINSMEKALKEIGGPVNIIVEIPTVYPKYARYQLALPEAENENDVCKVQDK